MTRLRAGFVRVAEFIGAVLLALFCFGLLWFVLVCFCLLCFALVCFAYYQFWSILVNFCYFLVQFEAILSIFQIQSTSLLKFRIISVTNSRLRLNSVDFEFQLIFVW